MRTTYHRRRRDLCPLPPYAKEIHRTVIHTVVEEADTFAPAINTDEFYLIGERQVEAGERDEHPMTFQHWIA